MRHMFRPRHRRPDPALFTDCTQYPCVTCESPQPKIPVRRVQVTVGNSEYSVTWKCPRCGEVTGVTFYAMSDEVRAMLREYADVFAPTRIVDAELGDAVRRCDAWGLRRAVMADLAALPVAGGVVSAEWERAVADQS